ncbi:MFS transporter [Streptomyces iconiensis]|uniref:MFS transporter n=1 Tax=Streptomyces iconiensis TaxID=1384038 RepID=A0ABT6ZUN6_9ACTN|nr:MFS transporter [Streptomyces iconiensis]MDJ1132780.1 MFS transporter [Streptomyces iconiensis]
MSRALGRFHGSQAPAVEGEHGFGARLMTPLLLGSVLNPVNSTMIATALVAIGRAFHVGAADTAWLVASLYLASAVAQPTLGKLADLLGPRRVFLAGLAVVVAAGTVGALAPAFGWLIASRVLLGVGTSAAYPCAMALLRAEGARLGRSVPRTVLARLSLASLGSAAVGPVLGGLLAATLGWRAIFAVNVPVALLGLLLAAVWLPRHTERRAPEPARGGGIDPLGVLLFGAALTTAMLFLMDLHAPRWPLLAPVAVLSCALVRWELRRPYPFLDLRMLARHGALVRTYLRHGLAYLVIYCVMYGFAQWLEESPGLSSFHAGLVLLPMSLAAAASSLLGARTKGIRGPLTLAAVLLGAGSCALLPAHGSTPLAALLLASVLFGLPQGLAGTGNQAAVAAQAPAGSVGAAAGLQRTAQYLGAITASSLIALFYGHRADDAGLHLIAVTVAGLSLALLVLTITDRALHGRSPPSPERT